MDKNSTLEISKNQDTINISLFQTEERQEFRFSENFMHHISEFETKEREQAGELPEEEYETEEEHERKRYGKYYDVSKRMTDIRHYQLSKLVRDERNTERTIDKKLSEFTAIYGALNSEQKKKFSSVASYMNNVFEETDILNKYIERVTKKAEPRKEEEKVEYQKQILSAISKANYIKNQHAISMRLIMSYMAEFKKPDFVEEAGKTNHILSAVESVFTNFGELKDAKYEDEDTDKAVIRAEAVKCILMRHGSEHTIRTEKPSERVERMRKKLVDDCVKKLNQSSDEELLEREEALKPYKERFETLISHDEKNVFSPFWIPLSMMGKQAEGDEEKTVHLTDDQLDIMNEASLNRYVLSSLCENIKSEHPNSAGAKMAELFDEAVIGFSATISKYSYDAHEETEKVIADKKLSENDRQKKLRDIRNKMVELSKQHGQVCERMIDTLTVISKSWTGDTINENETMILSVVENAKKMLTNMSPSATELGKMKVDLDNSTGSCEKAITSLSEFERYTMGLIFSTARKKDERTGTISGDTERMRGADLEKHFESELKYINITGRYRTDNAKDITDELSNLHIEINGRTEQTNREQQNVTQQTQTQQSQTQSTQRERVSKISQLSEGMEKHIPEKEMTKLKSYSVNGEQREGVGKCRAFWLRHGFISGGKLQKAVDSHVDRMLQSTELTDGDLAFAASNIGESTEIISDDMFKKNLKGRENTVIYNRLKAFKELSELKDNNDISESSKRIINMLGAQETDSELDFSDKYFDEYPQSLKVVLMYKLVKDITVPGNDKKSVEIRDRLGAAKSGISKLYGALLESSNYKFALNTQKRTALNVDYNSLTDMMYKGRKELASDEVENALDWSDYFDKQTDTTLDGLIVRQRHSKAAKKVIEEQVKSNEEDKAEYERKSLEEKKKRVKSNYERVLRRATGFTAEDRTKDLVRKPVPLPDYVKKVGQGAFEELLKMNLKTMMLKHFNNEKLASIYTADEEMLYSYAKRYAISSGYAGIKKESQLGELTLEQLTEFAALVSVRLSGYPKFLNEVCKNMKNVTPDTLSKEQREYVLSHMFTGKELDLTQISAELEVIKNRREFLNKNKNALLFGGKEIVAPRLYTDITKLKINTSGHDEIRAVNRLGRMDELDDIVEKACKNTGVQMPLSFYEFATQKRFDEEDKKSTKKSAEDKLISDYKKYITNEWYESVKLKDNKKQLENVKNILSADGVFTFSETKNRFKYFGLIQYGAVLSGAMGTVDRTSDDLVNADLLNDTLRSDFERHLSTNIIKNIVDKEVACRLYCKDKNVEYSEILKKQLYMIFNDADFEVKMKNTIDGLAEKGNIEFEFMIERRDKRVNKLKDSGYGMMLPIFFENDTFTDHLVADNDEEFDEFFEHYFVRAKAVADELMKQPYGEQYLIGKKQEILSYIFTEEHATESAKEFLNLEDYNKNIIEATVLFEDGKGKKITLGNKISEAIANRTKTEKDKARKEQISLEEGNLYTMALLFDGVGAVLDNEKMNLYRNRVIANTEALNKAFDAVIAEKKSEGNVYSEAREKAVRESVSQNERKNLFMVETEEFSNNINLRIKEWIDKIDSVEEQEKEFTTIREEIENDMKQLLNIKNAGRLRFAEYHNQTDNMRIKCESEYKNTIKKTGSRKNADTFFTDKINELSEKIREMMKKFTETEKETLPKNGALNAFYNETLVRMSYHAAHEDKEQAEIDIMLDHTRFNNVRSFYDIASKFLSKNESTKAYDETTRGNIIGGLLNFYGVQLLSESYLVTADVINRELKKLFDENVVGTEILRLLEKDTRYYSVGSDGYNYGETPLVVIDRKGFDQKLADSAKKDKKLKKQLDEYSSLDNETKILVGHLLLREANVNDFGGFFVKALYNQNIQAPSRTDVILSYMKGEKLTEADYKQVLDVISSDGKISADRFRAAVSLAKDMETTRTVDGLTVDKKTYDSLLEEVNKEEAVLNVSDEETLKRAEEVMEIANAVARDFAVEKYRTNIDKMWSFYTVLRPFKSEIDAYGNIHKNLRDNTEKDKKAELEGVTDADKFKEINDRAEARLTKLRNVNQFCKNFNRLEGYVTLISENERIKEDLASKQTSKQKEQSLKNAYKTRYEMSRIESYFYSSLGLTVSLSQMNRDDEALRSGTASASSYEKALSKNTEYIRDGFSDFLDRQAFRVDGFKTKSRMRRTDDDEAMFAPEIVKAVHEIDKWVAKNGNSLAHGNSETTFAADILGHPMRERLFVYYMVEKQHLDKPTGLDAAMAINGYIPDLDKFTEAVNAPKYKVHQYIISAIRDTDFVHEHESIRGALAGFGTIGLDKIESAIRMLDDEKMQLSDQLLHYKEALKSDYSDVLAKHPDNEKLAHYLELKRDRQEKLKAMLASLEKSRGLAQISDEAIINKKEKLEAAQKQALDVRMQMLMLTEADKKLAEEEDRVNKDKDLQTLLNSAIGRKIYNPDDEEQSKEEKIDGYTETANTIAGLLATADEKLFESGIFTTLNGITALAKIITTCYATDFSSEERSVNEKIKDATTIMDAISDAAEPVAEMIKTIVGSSSEIFGTVGGVISSAVTTVTGVVETVTAAHNEHVVRDARSETRTATRAMVNEAEKSKDKSKIREARELARAADNVGRMQENKYGTRKVQSGLKATGGAVSLATALIPGINVAGAVAGGIVTAVSTIHKFYKEKENRNEALDVFLGMDKLVEEYKQKKGVMDYGTEDDKELIRGMMLRKFHFSSAEQFFNDLSMKYAQHIYDRIFYKSDGTLVRDTDVDEIKAREEFTNLFPELKFIWPAKGGVPYPTVEQLAADLMKLS